jgi:cysteine desulfurase/selenocysteine lyase
MGSGALWARRELLEAMPFLAGGEMIREVHLRRSEGTTSRGSSRHGTPAVGDAIGLGVAADYLRRIWHDAVREHERELVEYALDVLPKRVPESSLRPADPKPVGGVIPFNLPGIHPTTWPVARPVRDAVRAGHHCTMPLHERLDFARRPASFNVYSTRDDIDALVDGLGQS